MSYLANMDEAEAVRLAYATMQYLREHPTALDASPFVVLADVLAQPPWRLSYAEAITLVVPALTSEGVPCPTPPTR